MQRQRCGAEAPSEACAMLEKLPPRTAAKSVLADNPAHTRPTAKQDLGRPLGGSRVPQIKPTRMLLQTLRVLPNKTEARLKKKWINKASLHLVLNRNRAQPGHRG